MKNKKGNVPAGVVYIIAVAMIMIAGLGAYAIFGQSENTAAGATVTPSGSVVASGCDVASAYSYSGIDAFSSTAAAGTNNIKLGSNKPVSTLAAPTAGLELEFWLSNTTGAMCEVVKAGKTQCGPNTIQGKCYMNSTPTITVVDTAGAGTSLTNNGGTNATLAASTTENLRIDYQAIKNRPNLPFGGCLAVEYPKTVTSLTVEGAGIDSSKKCPYQWTSYAPSDLDNNVAMYEIPVGFDSDGKGSKKSVNLVLNQGSSIQASNTTILTFQPAFYYVSNDGNFEIGIEKDKNDDTTKTYGTVATFKWYTNTV